MKQILYEIEVSKVVFLKKYLSDKEVLQAVGLL
jgi:hypothetical protein